MRTELFIVLYCLSLLSLAHQHITNYTSIKQEQNHRLIHIRYSSCHCHSVYWFI